MVYMRTISHINMDEKPEPFLQELSKEFDRYMHVIDIIEKKAHNLIIISGTFIAVLLGMIFIRTPNVDFTNNLFYIFVPISMLFIVIIFSTLAVRLSGQIFPIQFRVFFKSKDHKDDMENHIDLELLKKMTVNTKIVSKLNDKEKNDYNEETETKNRDIQQWLMKGYLSGLYSAIENGIKKSHYVRIAEIVFLLSIVTAVSMTAVFVITHIINSNNILPT